MSLPTTPCSPEGSRTYSAAAAPYGLRDARSTLRPHGGGARRARGKCQRRAETKERHLELADKGYTHVDPEKLRGIINKEGGAAGLDAIVDQADASEEEVKKTLDAMDDVATHKEGDLVIDDGDEVEISEGEICDAGIQYVLRTDA